MAFFQLTYMGPQDPIRARLAVHDDDAIVEPQEAGTSGAAQPPTHFEATGDAERRVRFPPIQTSPKGSSATLVEGSATAAKPAQRTVSHKEYEQNLRKHRRPAEAPRELYRAPLTTSQSYGWSVQDHATESWMKTPRHGHRNSEMTKFADTMGLTDREFSLF